MLIVGMSGGEWYQYIPSVQLALNTTLSQATGYLPFLIQHGRIARDPASVALLNENMWRVPFKEYLIEARFDLSGEYFANDIANAF